jgi:hypothetical protein
MPPVFKIKPPLQQNGQTVHGGNQAAADQAPRAEPRGEQWQPHGDFSIVSSILTYKLPLHN